MIAADYLCDVTLVCTTCNLRARSNNVGTGFVQRIVKHHAKHDVDITIDRVRMKRDPMTRYGHAPRAYTIASYT